MKRIGKKRRSKGAKVIRSVASITSSIKDLQTFDTAIAFSTNSNIVQYIPLFLPTAGTGTNSRYGDKTCIKSVQGSFTISPGSAQIAQMFLRVMLVWDKQPNSAAPTGPAPLTLASVTAFKSPDLAYRFQILKDMLIPVKALASAVPLPGATNNENQDVVQKWYFNNLNLLSYWVSSTGAVADLASGNLMLATVTNVVLTANDTPVLTGTTRVTYSS